MYSFDLDTNILKNHIRIATPVSARNKYEREQQRVHACVFLTNITPNTLEYTTFSPNKAIQSRQTVDFQLPCPIAINLYSINDLYKCKNAHVEIPECTLETCKMFHAANRPRFIRDSDLTTSVISVNGARANVEYIKATNLGYKFEKIINELAHNPIKDWRKYEWILQDDWRLFEYMEAEQIYQAVFHTDNIFPRNLMSAPDNRTVLQYLEKTMSKATHIGTFTKAVYRPDNDTTDVFKIPVAMFRDEQQQIIWMAKKAEKAK